MATADQYANWIVKNSDKKGTPEFDTVAAAYKEARGQSESAPTKGDIKDNKIYDGENWSQIYADEPPPAPIKPPEPSLLSKIGDYSKNAGNFVRDIAKDNTRVKNAVNSGLSTLSDMADTRTLSQKGLLKSSPVDESKMSRKVDGVPFRDDYVKKLEQQDRLNPKSTDAQANARQTTDYIDKNGKTIVSVSKPDEGAKSRLAEAVIADRPLNSELNQGINDALHPAQPPFDVRMREKRRLEATAKAQLFANKVQNANENGTGDTALTQAINNPASINEINQKAKQIHAQETDFVTKNGIKVRNEHPFITTANDLIGGGALAGAAGAIGGAIRGTDTSHPKNVFSEFAQAGIDLSNNYIKQATNEGAKQAITSVGQSIGYSATTMIPMLFGPAGWAVSGGMMYRGATNQFMTQVRQSYEQEHGAVSDETWQKKADNLGNEAASYGLWETVPELVSDRIFFGLIGKTFGKKAIGNLMKRASSGFALQQAQESISETLTNLGQNQQQYDANEKLGNAQDGARQSFLSAKDLWVNYKQVAPSILLQTLVMGGIGGLITHANNNGVDASKNRITNLINSGKLNQLGSGDLGLKIKQAQKYGWNDVEIALNEELSTRVTKPSNADIAATVTQASTLDEAITASAKILYQHHASSDHLHAAQQGFTDEEILQNLETQHPILAAHTDALEPLAGDTNVSTTNNTTNVAATASEPIANNAIGSIGNLPETSGSADVGLSGNNVASTPTASNASNLPVGNANQPNAPLNDLTTAVGEPINKDWAAFHEESGTKGIPRNEMPQIKSEHRGALVNFLNARGVSHTQETVSASSLKPTQAEFSSDKVAKAMGFEGTNRSILVSSDNHILDGHHQWLAKLADNENVDVIRLNAPIAQLLEAVKEFPSATSAKPVKKPVKKSGTLIGTLKELGGIHLDDLMDITGESKLSNVKYYRKAFNTTSRKSFKGHIESGALDVYLPPNLRLTAGINDNQAYDSTKAYDYLSERIKNGERVLPYDVEQEIKQNKYYAQDSATADSDIDEITNLLEEDEINEQLRIASNEESETTQAAREFIPDSPQSPAISGERQAGRNEAAPNVQPKAIKPQANAEIEGVRQQVNYLSKQRAFANEIGKGKVFDERLQIAKDLMAGKVVNAKKLLDAAVIFNKDKATADAFKALYEIAKSPVKTASINKKAIIEQYKADIANAKTLEELQAVDRIIQNDRVNLNTHDALALDKIAGEAQNQIEDSNNANDQANNDDAPASNKSDQEHEAKPLAEINANESKTDSKAETPNSPANEVINAPEKNEAQSVESILFNGARFSKQEFINEVKRIYTKLSNAPVMSPKKMSEKSMNARYKLAQENSSLSSKLREIGFTVSGFAPRAPEDTIINNVFDKLLAKESPTPKIDLLGDNTQSKQALADAERAKDTKRNTGNGDSEGFNLTGSDSEADQANAAGAQDLFAEPKKQSVKETNYNLTESDIEPRFLNKRSKLIEIDGKKITPAQAFKILAATRDDMNQHDDFIKCMGA